jgi:hypothetical protein
VGCRLRLKCDGTRTETKFRLSPKRTSPFKSKGASVQSTTGSQGVRISGSNAGYTMFRGSVKSTGYPLHSTVSPSLPLSCVTACHHISTGLHYLLYSLKNRGTQIPDEEARWHIIFLAPLYATLLAPGILKLLPDFWKICGASVFTTHYQQIHNIFNT